MSTLRIAAFSLLFLLATACGSRMNDRPEMGRADLGSVSPAGGEVAIPPPAPGSVLSDPNPPGGRTAVSPPVHDINDPLPAKKPPAKKKKKK